MTATIVGAVTADGRNGALKGGNNGGNKRGNNGGNKRALKGLVTKI